MRFLLDMGVSPALVPFIESNGWEALHLQTIAAGEWPDPAILQKARDEGWVLLTHDLDFAELVAESGGQLPSVILFRLRDMRPDNVQSHFRRVCQQASAALKQGAIVTVRESAIRIRTLPI